MCIRDRNFHGLDVLRIEEVDVVIEQAVYYIQRFVAVKGVCTAHTYFRICSCLARIDNGQLYKLLAKVILYPSFLILHLNCYFCPPN